jgi:hypothetical protein
MTSFKNTMRKQAFTDQYALAETFSEGDSVLFPIFTRGNRLAPHYGKVITVLEDIGMLDIASPMGVYRLEPYEVIKDESQDAGHVPVMDDYSTWEKSKERADTNDNYTYARPWKVAQAYHNKRIRPLAQKGSNMKEKTASSMTLYDRLFKAHSARFSDHEIKRAAMLVDECDRVKKSRHLKKNVTCPSCRQKYATSSILSVCNHCYWMARPEDRHKVE